MKKFKVLIFTIILLFISFCNIYAKNVTFEKAEQVASKWLLIRHPNFQIETSNKLFYNKKFIAYLFNLSPEGYILVPADDILPPIKAYSFSSDYIIHGKGFYILLEKELYNILSKSNKFSEKIFDNNEAIWKQILEGNFFSLSQEKELNLTAKWDQEKFYSSLLPQCSLCDDNGHYFVGCTAVATAQIMKYYNWPDSGRGYISYKDNSSGLDLSVNFQDSSYEWELMPNSLDNNSTESEIYAVAKLMSDVAIGMQSSFFTDGTGGTLSNAGDALYDFFKYYPPTYLQRTDYNSDEEWFDIFKSEIDNNRPVLFGISGSDNETGGHSVVLYGYRVDGNLKQVKLNIGWGGDKDGWYVLNNIIISHLNFDDVLGQDALIKIEKDNITEELIYNDVLGDENHYEARGYDTESAYGAIKFIPTISGVVSHISFILTQYNMKVEISLYSDEIKLLYKKEVQYKSAGWHYVVPSTDIHLDKDKTYYVLIKFTGYFDNDGKAKVLPIVMNKQVSGNSYIGNKLDSLTRLNNADIIIRLGITTKTNFNKCSSSDYSMCNNESDCLYAGGIWRDNKCSQSIVVNAFPATPQEVIPWDSAYDLKPSNTIINLNAKNKAYLTPSLTVDPQDVGKKATLVVYVFPNNYDKYFELPIKTVILNSVELFDNFFQPIDLSYVRGMVFDIYYGYIIDGIVKYNTYQINISK